ncbi:MAG: MEDS domain-containing protein [Candidatus Nitrosocosmicus sp.]|jgi:hypothetical protein
MHKLISWCRLSSNEQDIKNNIDSMHVEDATNTVLESPYGLHALIIYSDSLTLREFWSFYAKKSIEDKNEFVYLAPFYDTAESVRKTLSEGHMSIDIQKYEKSLRIGDSLEKYLDKNGRAFDKESVMNANQNVVEYANELNKNGASILGDLGAFLFKNQIQSLVDYECSLPTKFETNLKGICLYHQNDFDKLSIEQKKKIIEHHNIAIKI